MRNRKPQQVFKIKNQIYQKIPHVKDVDVNISKSGQQEFVTTIKAHLPQKKFLTSRKKDNSLKVSMEKAKQALLKQATKKHKKKKEVDKFKLLSFDDYFLDVS